MRPPIKKSRQREKILEILRATKEHPTAQTIFEVARKDFPRISLGTVYRNLLLLEELGLLQVISSPSSREDRYDADISTHYHFICESCGKVEDLSFKIPIDLDTEASRSLGRTISCHRLDFFGRCKDCIGPLDKEVSV